MLVSVPVSKPASPLQLSVSSMPVVAAETANAMHLALQELNAVQEIVLQFVQEHDQLSQEVQENEDHTD